MRSMLAMRSNKMRKTRLNAREKLSGRGSTPDEEVSNAERHTPADRGCSKMKYLSIFIWNLHAPRAADSMVRRSRRRRYNHERHAKCGRTTITLDNGELDVKVLDENTGCRRTSKVK